MNRAQRLAHRGIWWVLAPLLLALVAYAVIERVSYPDQSPPPGAAP